MSAAKEIRDLMGRCSRLEQQVAKLPTRIGNSAGGSGSGSGSISSFWVVSESKAELDEDVVSTMLGRVNNDGATEEDGRLYYRGTEDNWVCWSHLE